TLSDHPGVELRYELKPSPDLLARALEGVGAWLVRSETKVTADWIEKARALRLIGRAGVGVDNIDLKAATRRGIAVVNAPSANTIAACEHAMGLLLAVSRNIPQADADVKAGRWQRSKWMGLELQGKTLGIVGLGRIGREMARRAAAFGMRVVALDPFVAAEQAATLGVTLAADLKALLSQSDFVTLHAPSSDKTRKLLNAETLAYFKPGARLVNCARGDLIDEAALARALASGQLAAAALDVFSKEPLPADSPLRGLANLILTPHLGASTQEAQEKVAEELARSVLAFHKSGLAPNALNLPGFDAETLKSLGEYLGLAEALGRFAGQAIDSGVRELECRFHGDFSAAQRRPLAVAALKGLLSSMLAQEASYISAPALAAERGLRTSDAWDPLSREGFQRLLTVTAVTDAGRVSVGGTLLAPGQPRLVRFNDLAIEVLPQGKLLVLTNKDTPGVIGRIGTLLGEAGVNIADMRVGRLAPHGEAVMVLTVDEDVSKEVQKRLGDLAGITSVRWVKL
ncbi:MAG: phosphoglycerate dehydrogenase, partial [Elusimicrobia bacterium]|nr:phosphoglycerate dehydrogenase [Elusimicrobiota bacterium]